MSVEKIVKAFIYFIKSLFQMLIISAAFKALRF